jgi:hypothetical protein
LLPPAALVSAAAVVLAETALLLAVPAAVQLHAHEVLQLLAVDASPGCASYGALVMTAAGYAAAQTLL